MMRQTGKAKKTGAVLITAVLAAMLAVQTAVTVLADGGKASLTIQAVWEKTGIPGVEWSVYQVAEMPRDGVFALKEAFAGSGLDIDELNDSTQSDMQKSAKKLIKYVEEHDVEASVVKATDSKGKARMQGLERGLYLVCQTGTKNTDLKVESTPFFTALPRMTKDKDGKMVLEYDVAAFPKLEVEASPTTEPEESTSGESKPEESTSGESKPEESTSGESKPEESTSDGSKPEESTSDGSKPEESTQTETTASGGNSGNTPGGGGRSDRDHGGSSNRTIINDPEVPLASFPTSPDTPALEIVEDNQVPLAALPKLGDMGTGGALAGLLLSLTAASAALTAFRKFGGSEKTR